VLIIHAKANTCDRPADLVRARFDPYDASRGFWVRQDFPQVAKFSGKEFWGSAPDMPVDSDLIHEFEVFFALIVTEPPVLGFLQLFQHFALFHGP
jgi:hypothetical protein